LIYTALSYALLVVLKDQVGFVGLVLAKLYGRKGNTVLLHGKVLVPLTALCFLFAKSM
jgi:hypothetical protein